MFNIKRQIVFTLFVLPALCIYSVLFLVPLLQSLQYSLFQWDGIGVKNWAGLSNFKLLFEDAAVMKALNNNILYTGVVLVLQTILSLFLALLLYRPLRGGTFFRVTFFLPTIISIVSIGFTWSFIFEPTYGTLNALLHFFGVQDPPLWLGSEDIALYMVAIVNVWQFTGYSMLIFIAGLQAIPGELLEVCRIEGANAWHTLTRVKLPLILPSLSIVVVLTTVGSFKVFELIYVMTSGGPFGSTKVLAYEIYEQAFSYNAIGYSSAISVLLLVVVSLISFIQNRLFRLHIE